MSVKASSFVAVAALAAVSSFASASVIANGGFEAGSGAAAANWVQIGVVAPQRVVGPGARTGEAFLQFETPLVSNSVLLQNSVADGGGPDLTPGPGYVLSFWLKGTLGTTGNINYALRYLNSVGGIVYNSGSQNIFPGAVSADEWRQFGITGPAFPADANAVFIEIVSANGGDAGGQLNNSVSLDDVSVTVIPEPAAMGLLAPVGLLLARRRR
jgi:hypothetical protein